MDPTPFRVTLDKAGKRPQMLSRLVRGECLNGVVLCAQQWCVWSNAPGRGKLAKYGWYRVETRNTDGSWSEVASGSLADARAAWTEEDEARIDAAPMVLPLIEQQGTTKRRVMRTSRTARVGKSRLAQLVEKMQARK